MKLKFMNVKDLRKWRVIGGLKIEKERTTGIAYAVLA
jgi:hypothetical protein